MPATRAPLFSEPNWPSVALPRSIAVGPAAAPRWFDVSLERLPAYVAHLVESGATAVELVVLPGESPIEVARVHLVEAMWEPAVQQLVAAGLLVSVHAPLTERFRIEHLGDDSSVCADWERICRLIAMIERLQGAEAPLILHSIATDLDGRATTRGLSRLALMLSDAGGSGTIAIELRVPTGPEDVRFDRDRDKLARVVSSFAEARIGICWDIANDWLAAERTGHQYTLPDAGFLKHVRHVHVHDAHTSLGLHAPLGTGSVPWRSARDLLVASGWTGRITLEIRYRLANEQGEPWAVLSDSIDRFTTLD